MPSSPGIGRTRWRSTTTAIHELWWRILDANPQLKFGGHIMGLQGRTIAIPPGA